MKCYLNGGYSVIHYKKLKSAYLAGNLSSYPGFKESEFGYLKVTTLPCRVHEGDDIESLIVFQVTRSKKESQAIVVARKPEIKSSMI